MRGRLSGRAHSRGPVLTTTERLPGRPDAGGLAVAAATAMAYAALLACALWAGPWAVTVAALAVVAGEAATARVAPLATWGLDRVRLALPWRWAVASAAVAVLGLRTSDLSPAVVLLAGATLTASAGALEGLALVVDHLRKSPVLSRGLPLAGLRLPPEPGGLTRQRAGLLWPAAALLLVGPPLVLATPLPDGLAGVVGVVAAVAAVAVVGWATAAALRTRQASPRRTVPRAVQEAVTGLAPDVVLYFGGSADALYQVEMWLPTLEAGRHRTLVVLRDREAFRLLRPTSLPVVCIPAGTTLVSFDLSTVRGALFVSNAATNIHLIRKGGLRTAFIGHGDSDKASSRSPFTKVYDEIWVAGPAGAERYAGWETATVSDRLRQVGRPLVVPAAPASDAGVRTVLYAPTWEGWGDDPLHSSLPYLGVELVRRLLAEPGTRVLYRPHPLTGTRDAAVRRAHAAVVAMLRAAGATSGPATSPALLPRTGDELSSMTEPPPAAGTDTDARADAAWWAAAPPTTHRVVDRGGPSLASCFAASDALVADVSGVVSDWLALDRPLGLTDPGGAGAQEYAARFPSSRAGVLVGPGLQGLEELLADLRSGRDRTRDERARVREHLLGSPPEAGSQRFEAALDALVAEAAAGGTAGGQPTGGPSSGGSSSGGSSSGGSSSGGSSTVGRASGG